MTQEEYDEVRNATKRLNKALRTTNRRLRRQLQATREASDELAELILETETESERVFREMWETGLFKSQDYEEIAKEAIQAMQAQKLMRGR